MLQIVIPMAGLGSRFTKAGYTDPKPFIDVAGKPMIHRVIENLTPYQPHKFILLARREHEDYVDRHLSFADVIWVEEMTEGAACTVLLAKDKLNQYDPLVIANSDQIVEWNSSNSIKSVMLDCELNTLWFRETNNIDDMINHAKWQGFISSIATFTASHPKWSYAKTKRLRLAEKLSVTEVAEKKVISDNATVGVYYFETASLFIDAAHNMIKKNIRVNGEFYVCPVFNEIIARYTDPYAATIYPIHKMLPMGTPEDLEETLCLLESR